VAKPVFYSRVKRGDGLTLDSYPGRKYEIVRVDNQGSGIVHLVLVEVGW